jgi:integrase
VSRTTAKEELARKKTEVIEGKLNPAKARKSPRFDVFSEEYLDWVKANKKPLTYKTAQTVMKILHASFGVKRLNEISAWHMEQFKKARKDAGKALAAINRELIFLKALLNKAVAWDKFTEYPGRQVKSFRVTNERTRFLSEEEESLLLPVCSSHLRRIVEAGFLTGFRPQELTSLRPEDVDLERGLVTVASCYSKNGESRTLPMEGRLQGVLQATLATRGNAPTVFTTHTGKPWGPTAYGVCFLNANRRAGIAPCGPHTLRHTFASRLVMAGIDIRTVQELLGHKTIAMTLRYAHLSPDHKRKAMATLEERFPAQKSREISRHPLSMTSLPKVKVA